MEFRLASARFDDLLAEIADASHLTSRHQAYTVLDGVLRTFRRRLTPEQLLAFAQVLPPLVQSMLLAEWQPAPPHADWSPETLLREVRQLRPHHNLAPDNAIDTVATVLRRHVEPTAFEAWLAELPAPARTFWRGSPAR